MSAAAASPPLPHEIWLRAGIPVFPCSALDKHPLSKWRPALPWDELGILWPRYPEAMSGLDCERLGVVVIDCDNTDQVDGEANFRTLCRELDADLTHIPRVRTPRGGTHFYFLQDEINPFRNSAGDIAAGIDVRGVGGFVIAAGSRRKDGTVYQPIFPAALEHFVALLSQGKLPPVPTGLAERMRKTKNLGTPASSQIAKILPFPPREQALYDDSLGAGITESWSLEAACQAIANTPTGRRNDTLNKEAFIAGLKVASGSLDAAEARGKLEQAALAAGLEPNEIARTLSSALVRGSAVGQTNATGDAFERTDRGNIRTTFRNAMLAIERLGVVTRRNIFADVIEIANAPGKEAIPSDHVGPLTENSLGLLRKAILDELGFDTGKDHLYDAIRALAEEARYNPVADWLDGLSWDGTRRAGKWLPTITGCDDTDLNCFVGLLLLMAMIVRARFPGTKFDICVILEGEQGCGKSSLVKALGAGPGDYFADAPGLIGMDTKARAELVKGKWVVELSELAGLARGEIENVKAFLSQSSDQYRPAYGRVAETHPRRCVFVATTNADGYLSDPTGNRRFIPIRCGKIDLPGFAVIQDQLLAEVNAALKPLVRNATEGRPLPDRLLSIMQLPPHLRGAAAKEAEARRAPDPTEEHLSQLLPQLEQTAQRQADGSLFIPSASVMTSLQAALNGRANLRGLGTLMSQLGWKGGRVRDGNIQRRGYIKYP